eukprot:CAMPEP_0117498128 /NCGR_PEP_ID=MMETSP0784-20121206/21552_1 /TAXON_ID=39447 /ORGANISM="" /LENGTH=88 /DNA_ID=CAMNT_0005293199 /DNA_START=155 /DNA_END=421 /DNA_ORIENTATION=-
MTCWTNASLFDDSLLKDEMNVQSTKPPSNGSVMPKAMPDRPRLPPGSILGVMPFIHAGSLNLDARRAALRGCIAAGKDSRSRWYTKLS